MLSKPESSSSWWPSAGDDAQVFFLAMAYACWVFFGGVALFLVGVGLWL